jgi:hypothetical protein
MSNGFNKAEEKTTPKRPNAGFLKDIPGKITATIGSGDNARNTFVYLTLKWSFISGIVLTVLVVINNWFFVSNEKVPDIMGDLKGSWGIVVPIITLALGYAFGKSKE